MFHKLTQYQFVRYVIGGGTSAAVNLTTLYILHYRLGMFYIYAGVFAFMAAFFVSFTFHKFWTFKDTRRDNFHTQMPIYLLTQLFGLSMNTFILYISVSIFGLAVILGQIVAGGLTACCTFFISKHIVFKVARTDEEVLDEFL